MRNTLRRIRERHRLARRTNVEGPLWCNTRLPIVVARSLLGVPRISTAFQWIPSRSAASLNVRSCSNTTAAVLGVLSPAANDHLFSPMHHCKASRLSSWYGLGIFRSDKGTVEFNRKTKPSKRTWRSCIRSLHRIAHSLCRLGHGSQRFSGRSAHRRGRLTADQPIKGKTRINIDWF